MTEMEALMAQLTEARVPYVLTKVNDGYEVKATRTTALFDAEQRWLGWLALDESVAMVTVRDEL